MSVVYDRSYLSIDINNYLNICIAMTVKIHIIKNNDKPQQRSTAARYSARLGLANLQFNYQPG